jgi:hypothetical protein
MAILYNFRYWSHNKRNIRAAAQEEALIHAKDWMIENDEMSNNKMPTIWVSLVHCSKVTLWTEEETPLNWRSDIGITQPKSLVSFDISAVCLVASLPGLIFLLASRPSTNPGFYPVAPIFILPRDPYSRRFAIKNQYDTSLYEKVWVLTSQAWLFARPFSSVAANTNDQ